MSNPRTAPRFLDLTRIWLPLTGWLSISHRITGVLLFLALPAVVLMFELSLRDEGGFARVVGWLSGLPGRVFAVLLLWFLAHHLFSGIRFLLIDMGMSHDLAAARRTARLTLLLSAMALLGIIGGVW